MRTTIDKDLTCLKIRDLCYGKRVTVQMICDDLNLSKQTVYGWFSAKKLPSIDHMVELSDILDCPLDDLIGRRSY